MDLSAILRSLVKALQLGRQRSHSLLWEQDTRKGSTIIYDFVRSTHHSAKRHFKAYWVFKKVRLLYDVCIFFLSSEKVLSMERKRRNCIKKDEDLSSTGIKMEVYTNYSRDACLMECRARLLFKQCNCLPYYFPDFSRYTIILFVSFKTK